jgi:hypothetical protein
MRVRLKESLGRVPAFARLYDLANPARPRTRYNLEQLAANVGTAVAETRAAAGAAQSGRKLLLLATLHYWIEQAVMVGLALRGTGHEVALAYLPYSSWEKEINSFDLRRQDLYTRRILAPLNGLISARSLLGVAPVAELPASLQDAVIQASSYDVMYSLQLENVDFDSTLFRLRMTRNRDACAAAISLLKTECPDVVLIPNGLVTELGVFYQAARYLRIPTVTYEFNDQREQIWVAQNDIVMHQNTDELWQARSRRALTAAERQKIAAFEAARSGGGTYGKGTRAWQDQPAEGSAQLRSRLGLDSRPVVLLATNVLGDSLTLGRNLFASSMAEWIERTVQYFVARPEVQLVVRIHPGERLIKGPSMMRVIERAAPGAPQHIHVVGPRETTNTYDLMGLANVGLAYTTTVGLEMAMRGVPVVVAGKTHFRDRGFTMDPSSWDEYYSILDRILQSPEQYRLSTQQVDAAWNYAYRFFFDYPFDFPWRLMHLWKDVTEWPLRRVLSSEGKAAFGATFGYLAGEPIAW